MMTITTKLKGELGGDGHHQGKFEFLGGDGHHQKK